MLSVGAVVFIKKLRSRSRAKAEKAQSDTTPMMTSFNQSRFSFHAPSSPQQAYQPPARPPPSPLMGSEASYHDHGSSSSSSSSSHSSARSPMSENSSQFHFPLLSADGHLMPPIPASSRQSWNITEGDLGSGRPLPSAPGSEAHGYETQEEAYEYYEYDYSPNPFEGEGEGEKMIPYQYHIEEKRPLPTPITQSQSQSPNVHLVSPTPTKLAKWAYEPSRHTPSPEPSDESVRQIIGLYPSLEMNRDGTIQYDYGYSTGHGSDNLSPSIKSSPRVAQVQDTFGFHQPQSATYHRSFSAEGEEILADR